MNCKALDFGKDQLPIAFRNHPDYYFVVISSLPEVLA